MSTPKPKPVELLECCLVGCHKHPKRGDKYCSMHRARLQRTGRLDKKSPLERVLERSVKTAQGCLEYKGYVNPWGYGRIRGDGKKQLAHRLVFEAHNGPIPGGMLVCHRCDNPPCVNVEHLFLGTNQDNLNDSINKGRRDCVKIAKERWVKCPTFRKK